MDNALGGFEICGVLLGGRRIVTIWTEGGVKNDHKNSTTYFMDGPKETRKQDVQNLMSDPKNDWGHTTTKFYCRLTSLATEYSRKSDTQ